MSDAPTLTERLATHLLRPVAANVQTKARLHLLDWLACVAGARRSDVASVVCASEPNTLLRAAFLGNVLEMDDVHRLALLHPGPIVWPAALQFANDMASALDAAVRGYEAMIAVGATFDAYHYAHWHPTATAGVFGAAAAACSALGHGAEATVSALGTAGSVSGGLWQMRHEDVMTKQFHVAHAVRTGCQVAHLADCGMTAPRGILEGEQGLYAAMTRVPRPMQLDESWRIDEVSFKPWGACRHVHPAIDAALALKAEGRLVAPIRVETYADALRFCDKPEPRTVGEAKFSLQHGVAIVMAKGEPELEDFEPAAIERLAPLRAQVTVAEAPDLTAAYPAHFGARIGDMTVRDALGDPERPLSTQGVQDKARALFAWGGLDADEAIDAALDGNDVSRILTLLEQMV